MRDSLLLPLGTTRGADRLDQAPFRRDRAAGRRELLIHIVAGARGEGHDQAAEEREKAPASARGGQPEQKRSNPALRLQGRTRHPCEREDRDGRVEQEPKSKERGDEKLQPRDGRLSTFHRKVGQSTQGSEPMEFNLLFLSLHLITKARLGSRVKRRAVAPVGSSRGFANAGGAFG